MPDGSERSEERKVSQRGWREIRAPGGCRGGEGGRERGREMKDERRAAEELASGS